MEIKVPSVGESVYEAQIGKWLKRQGERVARDEPVCELETEKITLEINAEADGVLNILAAEGTMVKIGATIGMIEEKPAEQDEPVVPAAEEAPLLHETPAPASPAARKLAREEGIALDGMTGSGRGGRVMPEDLQKAVEPPPPAAVEPSPAASPPPAASAVAAYAPGRTTRKPMTPIRKKITAHLIQAVQQTAMLTTFNEADMGRILEMKRRRKPEFLERFGFSPGLVPFFVRAAVAALLEYPEVNARIDGDDIVYHQYCDIGIAIGAEKGLVVPVLRGAEALGFWETERGIRELSAKVAENRLGFSDLEGGTFTISNGGVYGSLLSTPMLNMPQAAVLGMHAIQERPVARDSQIVIRPMMYLALTYDHRLIDGRQAVGFLKRVKEYVEAFDEGLLS